MAHHVARHLLIAVAACSSLLAMAASEGDARVTSIVTAGNWEHQGSAGNFRIVVSVAGVANVTTSVVAEWVETVSEPSAQARVLMRKQVLSSIPAMFNAPDVAFFPNRMRVSLRGVLPRVPTTRTSCVFDMLGDGTVRVVEGCT
jgi:hypothetical protein